MSKAMPKIGMRVRIRQSGLTGTITGLSEKGFGVKWDNGDISSPDGYWPPGHGGSWDTGDLVPVDDAPTPEPASPPEPFMGMAVWDPATGGYVPVTDPKQAAELAKKAVYPAPPPMEERKWKNGDRAILHVIVVEDDYSNLRVKARVGSESSSSVLYPFISDLHPEASQPVPIGDWVSGKVAAENVLMREHSISKDRHALMLVGDLRGNLDLAISRLADKEIELGRLEREANRLRLELKAARALIARRGGI